MTCYFNNAAPHFKLSAGIWNLIDIRKEADGWYQYTNGVKGGKVNITSDSLEKPGTDFMQITFDANSEITYAPIFYLSRMRATVGTAPVIASGIGNTAEHAVIDTALITSVDGVVTIESVTAPDGTSVTLDKSGKFTANLIGNYKIAAYTINSASGLSNRVIIVVSITTPMLFKFTKGMDTSAFTTLGSAILLI